MEVERYLDLSFDRAQVALRYMAAQPQRVSSDTDPRVRKLQEDQRIQRSVRRLQHAEDKYRRPHHLSPAKVLKDMESVLEDLIDIALGGPGSSVQLRAAQLLLEFAVPPLVKAPDGDLPNVVVNLGPRVDTAQEWLEIIRAQGLDRRDRYRPT